MIGGSRAPPHLLLATGSHVTRGTGTDVTGEVGVASSTVQAGPRGTSISALAAVVSSVAQGAGAAVAVGAVHAGAAVGTGVGAAVVHVVFASCPRETGLAFADDAVTQIQAVPT